MNTELKEALKNINILLYKKTQEELIDYILDFLVSNCIEFQYYDGNIVSLNYPDHPIFVAHMDTVNDKDMKETIYWDKYKNILYRKNGILGADDRAGVNLILNHCHNINFILTIDEEIGGIGANYLIKNTNLKKEFENYSCCIELDRMNNNHILGSDHGYCEVDLQEQLEKALPGYKSDTGIFTDVDAFYEYIACCNISVGYYRQHTVYEYLSIPAFDYINSRIPYLAEITGKYEIAEPLFPEFTQYGKYFRNQKNFDDYDYYQSYYSSQFNRKKKYRGF